MVNVTNIFRNWKSETVRRVNGHGIRCASTWLFWHFSHDIPKKIFLTEGYPDGVPIFNLDWDILIVLDACRLDLMNRTIRDYEWAQEQGSIRSVAGDSSTWMVRNFDKKYKNKISKTAYLTANPHSKKVFNKPEVISPNDFEILEEIWKNEWDHKNGTVKPSKVTDYGIKVNRHIEPEYMILHYMQPHFPSIPDPIGSSIDLNDMSWDWSIWERLKNGEISANRIWQAYKKNLEYVLDSINTLLNNTTAERVLITSDHGNAMGERGYFGHGNYPVSAVAEVPLIKTSATDHQTRYPEIAINSQSGDYDVQERLKALGYK